MTLALARPPTPARFTFVGIAGDSPLGIPGLPSFGCPADGVGSTHHREDMMGVVSLSMHSEPDLGGEVLKRSALHPGTVGALTRLVRVVSSCDEREGNPARDRGSAQ